MGIVRGVVTLGYFFGASPVQSAWGLMRGYSRKQAQAMLMNHGLASMRLGGLQLEVDGDEHLPIGNYVLVYNEGSWPDLMAYHAALWGRYIDRGVAAAEFGLVPFAGRGLQACGMALMPRGDRDGVERVLAELVESLRAGERVAIGGEGRMSGTDGVIRFKRGPALLAIRSGKPLVPMASHGGHLLNPWGTLKLKAGTIQIRFGPPIPTDGLTDDDARDLSDRAQAAVAGLYQELAEGT